MEDAFLGMVVGVHSSLATREQPFYDGGCGYRNGSRGMC